MVKISGWVFLIIGGIFSGTSLFINTSQKTNNMNLFLYFGYLFIAYGIAKILISYISGKDKNEKNIKKRLPENNNKPFGEIRKESKNNNQQVHHHINNTHQSQNNIPSSKDSNGYIGYCSRCGTPMRNLNVYCHRCGMKQ